MSKTATVKLKTEGVKELTTELNAAAKAADKLDDSLEDTADAADDVGEASKQMSGGLDKMSGGLITMFKGAVKGAKTFVLGLKTLKGAMIATGVGALVVAVGSLVAFFTKTQKGAEMLEIASASLGVVMGKLTDTFSKMGGIMISIFTDPVQAIKDFGNFLEKFVMDRVTNLMDGLGFLGSAVSKLFKRDFAGAMADAKKGVENLAMANPLIAGTVLVVGELVDATKELVDETTKAVTAQNALTKASQDLRQAERDLIVDEAKKLAIIAEQEVISKDITKSFAERIAANKKAQEAEASVHAQRVANAKETLRIHQEEISLTESLEADFQREAELIAAVTNLDTQSAKLKKKFVVEEGMLNEQMAAEAKAIDDAELLRIATLKAATQSAEQNEIDVVAAKYIKLHEMARGNEETEKLLKEKQEADLLAITEKYAAKEEEVTITAEKTKQEKRQETIDAVVAMTQAAFSLFAALDQGRDDDDKKTAKARFKRAKAMQIAGAVMSTGSAIIGALSPPPVGLGPTPAGFAASITSALTGAASIASISKTRFDSAGSGTPSAPSAPRSENLTTALVPDTFAPSTTAPTDLESLTNKPIKAYVVGQDMTSQQELDANLLHHATL
tara:strand:+ start:1381 stop:3234 length:1854 start_codon:yes stop_codon:yes gene_type:complete